MTGGFRAFWLLINIYHIIGAHGRLRLTGRATLAAAKMETDSPTLHYGIHAIEDTFVRRNARGIFVAPAAKMYKACSTMNNKIVFSGTYDIVYLEGSDTHRVSMAYLRKNGNMQWCQWMRLCKPYVQPPPSANLIMAQTSAKMKYI